MLVQFTLHALWPAAAFFITASIRVDTSFYISLVHLLYQQVVVSGAMCIYHNGEELSLPYTCYHMSTASHIQIIIPEMLYQIYYTHTNIPLLMFGE